MVCQALFPCDGGNVKIGVPENYDGIFPWYLAKVSMRCIFPWYLAKLHALPLTYTDLLLTGDEDGIFGVEGGMLYALKPLDREKQPSYSLQVSFTTAVRTQGFTVEVCVIDKNDNVPQFIEESMRGSVQLGLLKGIPFMQVEASDRDEHNTPHAELRFSLMDQTPRIPTTHMFLIDTHTGEVSLTEDGASMLDPEMCGRYKLAVMVRDMGGEANAFFSTGMVIVEVTGNTWASPDPVRLQENLPGPYPIPISQVTYIHTYPIPISQVTQTLPHPHLTGNPDPCPIPISQVTHPYPIPISQVTQTPLPHPHLTGNTPPTYPIPISQVTHPYPIPISQVTQTPLPHPHLTGNTDPCPIPISQVTHPYPIPISQVTQTPLPHPHLTDLIKQMGL
ncbi:hypothetical protein ACEWY4_015550 [Coilia grayii]|uniref:Cadherin domain-containing protein n=1 Tax=Coilia grayii TaxID=363190 RepID=A0ABD1JPC4_9TELE